MFRGMFAYSVQVTVCLEHLGVYPCECMQAYEFTGQMGSTCDPFGGGAVYCKPENTARIDLQH